MAVSGGRREAPGWRATIITIVKQILVKNDVGENLRLAPGTGSRYEITYISACTHR